VRRTRTRRKGEAAVHTFEATEKEQEDAANLRPSGLYRVTTSWSIFSHVFTRKGRKQMRVHGRHQRAVSFGTVFVAVVINACCLVHLYFHIALVTFPSTFFRNMLLYQATRVGGLPPT